MKNLKYYIPGTLLIIMALLIVAVPEILVAFVAGLFIMAGIGALLAGHRAKKYGLKRRTFVYRVFDDDFWEDSLCRVWYNRY